VICYATSTDEIWNGNEIVERGTVKTISTSSEPHLNHLLQICGPTIEVMVSSLAIRIPECSQRLIPTVCRIMAQPQFLEACALSCGIQNRSWNPIATFTGLPSLSFSHHHRIGRPEGPALITVFALELRAWKDVHHLNNALMAMTLLMRHQTLQPCKFFATHPSAGRDLHMSYIFGEELLTDDFLPDLCEALNRHFPMASFKFFNDALFQNKGNVHLFMFSWSQPIQSRLEQLVFDACTFPINSVERL